MRKRVARRRRAPIGATTALVASLAGGGCAAERALAFPSPEAAVESLVDALRAHDVDRARAILGPGAHEVLSSGDAEADRRTRETFLAYFDEHHRLVSGSEAGMTLLLGRTEWPMPIPLVDDGGEWSFDTEAGLDEILTRRIGRNELDAIEVCRAFVDAQREYAALDPDGDGVAAYAERVFSDPGTRNGLYWPTAPGEPPSPLGERVAAAVEEGYPAAGAASGGPRPFHGYFYKLLKSQDSSAPGGALDYVVDGMLVSGFALLAYPAEYGNSGIMTFLVHHSGVIWETDLGDATARIARGIDSLGPGRGWSEVE